jgi:hypothetical protein
MSVGRRCCFPHLTQHSPDTHRWHPKLCSSVGSWSIGVRARPRLAGGESRWGSRSAGAFDRPEAAGRSWRIVLPSALAAPAVRSRQAATGSQAVDPAQDRSERRLWYRQLGYLEHHTMTMGHDSGADLHESFAQARREHRRGDGALPRGGAVLPGVDAPAAAAERRKKRIRALCLWHFQPGGGPEYCRACRNDGLPEASPELTDGSVPTASTHQRSGV